MSSLYELTSDWLQLMDLLENEEVDEQVVQDTLEGLEGEIEDKLQNCIFVIRNLEKDMKGFETEEKRMKKGKETCETRIKSLKKYMQTAMEVIGKEKVKTKFNSLWIQNNTPSVVMDVQSVDDVPIEYLTMPKPTINKTKIAEDIKAGVDLSMIAHLESTRSIRFR